MEEINELKNFFLDLDKTVWNWNETLIGVEDAIDTLRESDRNVRFHTDNTLLSREEYAKKLTSMGIPAEESDVITSGYVAAEVLAEKDVTKVYAMGESGLMDELDKKGIEVSEDADVAVLGFDRQFSYNKLRRAMEIAKDGEVYVCSTEKTFRKKNTVQPHQKPLNSALSEFGDVKLLGKPSALYREKFREYFSFFPEKSIFIGDRLADIETGNRLGMKTAAVMSGDIDEEALMEVEEMQKPDYGLSSLYRLKKVIL